MKSTITRMYRKFEKVGKKAFRLENPIPPDSRRKVGRCICGKEMFASVGQIIRRDKCRHVGNKNR